jgi:hypothetical protein
MSFGLEAGSAAGEIRGLMDGARVAWKAWHIRIDFRLYGFLSLLIIYLFLVDYSLIIMLGCCRDESGNADCP